MTTINTALAGYMASQADETAIKRAQTPIKVVVPQAAVDKAASTAKASTAAQKLEAAQQALGTELRAALSKAGVKLQGRVEFAVKGDGTVTTTGSEADKAAVKAFLGSDASKPSFASRIANQAQEALKLSASIQQGAAIAQAARLSKSPGGVMSLYSTLMQQTPTASAVFSVSASASSLTYPGSLRTNA